jgi:hypothetical protein
MRFVVIQQTINNTFKLGYNVMKENEYFVVVNKCYYN